MLSCVVIQIYISTVVTVRNGSLALKWLFTKLFNWNINIEFILYSFIQHFFTVHYKIDSILLIKLIVKKCHFRANDPFLTATTVWMYI